MRRISRPVKIGNLVIGGSNPIRVQSMTKTDTRDIESTTEQILALEERGCEIIRVAVPDEDAANAISAIKKNVHIPIVADIHFDPRLAVIAIDNGADKIRLNPSNIHDPVWVREISLRAKEKGIPIRVGANLGSFKERPSDVVSALVDSIMREINILREVNFNNIVISIKSSDIITTIRANELIAKKVDFPIHLGITEAGLLENSLVKNSAGIGYLLLNGIGDTIRFSITDKPEKEVKAGFDLLKSLHLRDYGLEIIACPTCGRTEIDVMGIAKKIEKRFSNVQIPIKVAVMGCAVNGPGEAKDADIGIAGGKRSGVIFKNGKIVKTIDQKNLYKDFVKELKRLIEERQKSL
jgi:(E)-4-hydroxy-3-methylbut-2-enyl-diphosphate synthase